MALNKDGHWIVRHGIHLHGRTVQTSVMPHFFDTTTSRVSWLRSLQDTIYQWQHPTCFSSFSLYRVIYCNWDSFRFFSLAGGFHPFPFYFYDMIMRGSLLIYFSYVVHFVCFSFFFYSCLTRGLIYLEGFVFICPTYKYVWIFTETLCVFFYLVRGLIFFDAAFFFNFHLFILLRYYWCIGGLRYTMSVVFVVRIHFLFDAIIWQHDPGACHSISFPLSHLGIMGISSAIMMIPEKKKTKKKMMRKNCTE